MTPFGWAYSASVGVIGVVRKVDDPTRANIPLVGDNPEAKFFSMLQKFRSADGGAFDFRGDKDCSFNERDGTLANSNERSEKGFVPTNELGKSFGIVGQYKLDWMFILPPNLAKPKEKNGHRSLGAPLWAYVESAESQHSAADFRSQPDHGGSAVGYWSGRNI